MITNRINLKTDSRALLTTSNWRKEWLIALVFFVLYSAVCILLSKNTFVADEGRYMYFADNLLNGYYSPPPPDIYLWNGPGYPIFLAFFLLFQSPLILLKLLNGVLLSLALVLYYKTATGFSNPRRALLFTVLLGLYYPIYRYLPYILTECLTWFLFAMAGYWFFKSFREYRFSWGRILLAAFSLAFLALTKVIIGYAILGMILFSAVALILPDWRQAARKSLAIFSIALLFCMPYLAYTYSLTGKAFYWSNAGGMSLYTMSTPFPGEHGDWMSVKSMEANPNHQAFMAELEQLNPVERDAAYKARAIENIKAHPGKFAENFVHNLGRLFFFPSANAPDNLMAYYAFPANLFVVVLIVLALLVAMIQYRRVPPQLVFLLLFVLLYLAGSSVVSTYRRMFFVTMPFWILFLHYVFEKLISIKLIRDGTSSSPGLE